MATGPDDLDDLRQEILTRLWQAFPSFRGEARFSTWMYRVALNTALMERRSRRTRPRETPLSAEHPPVAPTPLGVDPDRERLHREIRRLSELDRAVILLYLEQHTHAEIADLTGLGRKNVGVRIVRIKRRLRERLTGEPATERRKEISS